LAGFLGTDSADRKEGPELRLRHLLPSLLLLVAAAASADVGLPVGKVKRCVGSVHLERAGGRTPVSARSRSRLRVAKSCFPSHTPGSMSAVARRAG
jgi:hypothetical protein